MLLLEGGAAGHIMHLYEDYELTFNQIKNIIEKLTSNQIQCTEKTDGLNIYFGYKDRSVRAVRNKTEFKLGGLDYEHFDQEHFNDNRNIKQIYNDAFISFERSVSKLSEKEVREIFGDAQNIYLNCEIISGKTNIIPYDKNLILIHRSGHKQFDEESGILKVLPDEENVRICKTVEVTLPTLNSDKYELKFEILLTPFKQLTQIFDLSYVDTILQELTNFGFTSEMNIKDFLKTRILRKVNETIKNNFISEQLTNKILGLPTSELVLSDSDIGDKQELRAKINSILSNQKYIKKQAIEPLENAIHKIGVILLSNQKSDFIQDQNKAIQIIKGEIQNKINKIQSLFSQDEKKIQKASREIQKIGNINNIDTTIEGIVFQINNKVYKLTGNFAPINQIVNLTENKTPKNKTIVIFSGRFQPFHKGHMAAYQYLIDKFGQENVNIFTSDLTKGESPLDFEERKKIINFAGIPNQYIWYAAEPYNPNTVAQNLKIDPQTTTLIYAISTKDMIEDPRFSFKANEDGSPSYMQPYKNSFESMNKHCYILTYPKVDFTIMDKEFDSSKQIRDYFPTLDNEQQRLFIKDLYGRYNKDIHKLMDKKLQSINLTEIIKLINESVAAGMSSGAVEGGQGVAFKSKNYDNSSQNVITHSAKDLIPLINKRLKELENE